MIISETSTMTYGVCLDPKTAHQALLWCGSDKGEAVKTCAAYIKSGVRAVPSVRCEVIQVSIYTGEEGK